MEVIVTETKVYTFEELSEDAKEKALEKIAASEGENFDHEFTYEDASRMGKILGIELDTKPVRLMGGGIRNDPRIWYSGFYSQGDGACFEGSYSYAKGCHKAIRREAPKDTTLHRIADALLAVQRKHFYKLTATVRHSNSNYYHAGTIRVNVEHYDDQHRDIGSEAEEAITEAMRDFCNWIYAQLKDEYEYRVSKEACAERATDTDMKFLEDGSIYSW